MEHLSRVLGTAADGPVGLDNPPGTDALGLSMELQRAPGARRGVDPRDLTTSPKDEVHATWPLAQPGQRDPRESLVGNFDVELAE